MKVCCTALDPVAVKVIVPPAAPNCVVVRVPKPEFAPPDAKETPEGKAPADIVGVGLPVAVTVNVLDAVDVLNVVLLALVKTGARFVRLSVKFAVIGASEGTFVNPQCSVETAETSVSTATIDVELRLKTYDELVAPA